MIEELSPEVIRALNTSQVEIPPIGLEYLSMSEEEKAKMSFNTADQQFMFHLIKQSTDNIKAEQANSIAAQNVLMHTKLEMITDGVNVFIKNKSAIEKVGQYDERIRRNEKRTDRLIIAVFVMAIIMLLIVLFGPWYHNQFLSIFYKEKKQTSEWVESVRSLPLYDKGITRDASAKKRTDAEITENQKSIEAMIKPIK